LLLFASVILSCLFQRKSLKKGNPSTSGTIPQNEAGNNPGSEPANISRPESGSANNPEPDKKKVLLFSICMLFDIITFAGNYSSLFFAEETDKT